MRLSEQMLRNRKFTLTLTVGMVLVGLLALLQINAEEWPSVNIGTVVITTPYPGASAEEVEAKITKPIEEEIRTVDGVKDVRSISKAGSSKIITRIDIDHYETSKVVQDLQRAVDRTQDLPPDLPSQPEFLEIKSDIFPVVLLAIVGSNTNRLRDRVADELREELEENSLINGVRLIGYDERQFNVLLNEEALEQYHVGIDEVIDAIRSRNVIVPGGRLKSNGTQKLLRIEGKVQSAEDLGNIIVRASFEGEKIRLKDVATVVDGEEEPQIIARYESKPATLAEISKKGGSDIRPLTEQIQKTIDLYREKYRGRLEFITYVNEGRAVNLKLGILGSNAIIGLLMVFAFMLLFLPGRVGVMAALSLPISLLGTLGFMLLWGFTLNTMTILALIIALGMLVDNSVVISENYVALRQQGLTSWEAALKAVRMFWLPITVTALTTMAAFLPMMVTSGTVGEFIYSLPIIVTAALFISLIESFFFLPTRLLSQGDNLASDTQESKDWFARLVQPRFETLMKSLLRWRYGVAVGFTVILVGSILLMGYANKFILFPADQTDTYFGRLEMPPGTRLEETSIALGEISEKVKDVLGKDLDHVTSQAGQSGVGPNDPKEMQGDAFGLILIRTTEEAKLKIPYTDIVRRLRSIEHPKAERLSFENEIMGPPIGDPVSITFRSNQGDELNQISDDLVNYLSSVDGIIDARVDRVIGDPEVFVNVDYENITRSRLNLKQVGDSIRAAIAGLDVSDVTLHNKEVDLFVRFQDQDKRGIGDLEDLKIREPLGNLVPLRQFASFQETPGTEQIKRFDYKRSKTVTANVNTDVITAVEANQLAQEKFNELQEMYPSVILELGGEGESTQESFDSLLRALLFSMIGIFALLVFLFNSFARPLIVISTIPLGIVGVSLSFFLHGRPISFFALIGILGLAGIIVNTGIVLISFIDQMREQNGKELFQILLEASSRRFRAIIITALTTVAGLIPTAYGFSGEDEFIIPLTLALSWGLASGTLLALLWVPCAYLIQEDLERLGGRVIAACRQRKEPKSETVTKVKVVEVDVATNTAKKETSS